MSRYPPALLLAAAALLVAWAPPPPRFDEAAAAAVAAEVLAKAPSAGLTIAVERRGEVLFARGYGLANVKDRAAASGETVYPICSISKNFAAAAVLKLAEQGRVAQRLRIHPERELRCRHVSQPTTCRANGRRAAATMHP